MGSETKHSPLPWRWDQEAGCYILDQHGDVAAEIPCQSGNRSNGPFIVSAVNSLQQAAQGLIRALEEIAGGRAFKQDADGTCISDAVSVACAALKAWEDTKS